MCFCLCFTLFLNGVVCVIFVICVIVYYAVCHVLVTLRSDVPSRCYDSYLGLLRDSFGVANGLPRDCQQTALGLPSVWLGICEGSQDCLRAAVGLLLVLPMAYFGIGEGLIAKGLLRDCGIANLLFWDSAIVALGLPRESRAMALGIALGMP